MLDVLMFYAVKLGPIGTGEANSSRAALAAGKMVFSEGAGRLPQ